MTDTLNPVTPEAKVLQRILDALGVDDLHLQSRGLFEQWIREVAKVTQGEISSRFEEVQDEQPDPAGDAYAKGYADGYKAKAIERESGRDALEVLSWVFDVLYCKFNLKQTGGPNISEVLDRIAPILKDDFAKRHPELINSIEDGAGNV